MPLDPDDTICFCFHVPLRKIENFCRREKPRAASQISECLAAGTGCGWCVPMLRKVHAKLCGEYKPWWKQEPADGDEEYHSAERDASQDAIDAEHYAAGRQKYLAQTHRKPPTES
jgi:NAD(P)H-nitrite reductase large subunit